MAGQQAEEEEEEEEDGGGSAGGLERAGACLLRLSSSPRCALAPCSALLTVTGQIHRLGWLLCSLTPPATQGDGWCVQKKGGARYLVPQFPRLHSEG